MFLEKQFFGSCETEVEEIYHLNDTSFSSHNKYQSSPVR